MNYLAHLFLAGNRPESVIGSLMGDFVKGRVDPTRPPALRHAILQHRRIDSFTDAHPLVKQSKQRINPEFRRYAGITSWPPNGDAMPQCRSTRLPSRSITRSTGNSRHSHPECS